MRHEVLTALGRLRARPAYSLTAIAMLAVAIASNVAVFAVLSRTLFRPLPFSDPSALFIVQASHVDSSGQPGQFQVGTVEYVHWRERSSTLAGIEVIRVVAGAIREKGQTDSVKVGLVSGGLFRLLAVAPLVGRDFGAGDDRPESTSLILSHGLWERRFGRDPHIIGRTIVVDAKPRRIIGVMPADFEIPRSRADVFMPMGLSLAHMPDRPLRYLNAMARLRQGVSPAAAQVDLNRISAELGRAYPPTHKEWSASVRPMRDVLYGDRRPALLLLWGAVVLVHLLACVNVANLMLVQIADQRPVSAVRLALGARPGAMVRYRMAEGLLISLVAAGAGAVLGALLVQAILRNFGDRDLLAPAPGSVLMITAFVAGLTILTALAVALMPSLRESRISISALLNEGSHRASASARNRRARDFFIVAEVALAIPLLIGAALTVKRFRELSAHELGFDPNGVLTAQLIMPGRYADREQRARFVAEFVRRLEEKPGVQSAAITTCTFRVDESPVTLARTAGMAELATVNFRRITPGYFATMATPLLAGRPFTAKDVLDAPPVAIVSESLARRFWPGANPIGQTLVRSTGQVTVIGVAPDIRDSGVAEDIGPTLYLPYLQNNSIFVSAVVRSTGDAAALRDVVTKTIHEIDPHLAPDEVIPLRDLVHESLGAHRLQVVLFGGFGSIALVLAVVGIFAVTSYGVGQRMPEVGIRMAFGASPRDVVTEIVRGAGQAVLVGVVVGIALAGAAMRWTPELATSFDVRYATLVVMFLIASGLAASLIPALRARAARPAELLKRG